jgi:hypothetical protein
MLKEGRAVLVLSSLLLVTPVKAATMNIVIETLEPEARACGISEETLKNVVSLTLRKNRVNVVDRKVQDYLYVAVTALRPGSRCAASFVVEVSSVAMYRPNAQFRRSQDADDYMAVCSKYGVVAGDKGFFQTKALEYVEVMVKQCLGSLKY